MYQSMKSITEIYNNLWSQSLPLFNNNKVELDPFLLSANDNRRGTTVLARLSEPLIQEVESLIHTLRQIEPDQYYYDTSSFHVTLLSIITCHDGFTLESIDLDEVIKTVSQSLYTISPFQIQFQGLTASPSCVMIQGFPLNKQLNQLRNNLRYHFKQSQLMHSIDQRYPIQTAHSTIMRFQKPLKHPQLFVETLLEHKNRAIGTLMVDQVELVFNDWYQKSTAVKRLHTFELSRDNIYDPQL